ncbi:MAG TPA: amidohydrolase family protein [Streptosporangiaceae bacterium]
MAPPVDLSGVPVIDNHCHAVAADQEHDPRRWRGLFTESGGPVTQERDVTQTAFYQRLLRAMAGQLGVPATEAAVLAARAGRSASDLVAELFPAAGISGVVVDTGFPAPDRAMPAADFAAAAGCSYQALLRLEVMFERLVTEHATWDGLRTAVAAELADLPGRGFAGLKCIAGYRTGLAVERWPEAEARAAFGRARDVAGRTGTVRLGHKPLLDTLLHDAFAAAAAQGLPVQFHVGYGDADVDLRRAGPLELRAVLEEPAYRSMPVILLHGCWPYFREGAYLASLYDHVYLDLSYAIPFLSTGELRSMTRAALGTAPVSKLMYSSDGARVPELHWLGARDGRRVLGEVLGELVADGDLGPEQARAAGRAVLHDNAARVYGFGDRRLPDRYARAEPAVSRLNRERPDGVPSGNGRPTTLRSVRHLVRAAP